MKESISQTQMLIDAFGDAEYRFLLLEPLLHYGIVVGLVLFGWGFFTKQGKLQSWGLAVTGVSALVFHPYIGARMDALPRIEQVFKFVEEGRGQAFRNNSELWLAASWKYYALAFFSLATLLIGSRRNQLGYSLSALTVFLGLFSVQNSLWLHYQDASVVHPNLKSHEAPFVAERGGMVHPPDPPVTVAGEGTHKSRLIRPID